MLRTLLPLSLALLLAPSTALAARSAAASESADADGGGVLAQSGDRAERSGSQKKSSGGSRSSGRSGGSSKSGGGGRSDSDRSDSSRADGGRSDGGRSDGGRSDEKGGEPRSGARPAGSDVGSNARPTSSAPGPMTRGDEGRGDRSPTSGPVTRQVNVGAPGTAAHSPASPSNFRSAAPANFRSSSTRPDADRGVSAERRYDGRDGGSSGAVRATHGDTRHAEASRHAHATAAHHRHAAAYDHRSAAARHHAWASYSHGRYGHRNYGPGGWFRPYRPGHAYWYHGVFVYGPRPGYAYRHDGGGAGDGGAAQMPERKVDRSRTFALGVRGGSYLGGYSAGGGGYGDAGLGLAARYRMTEAVGLEVSWMHHDQTWDEGSERVNQPLQASVQLFGMPWTKVNPYVLAGVTVNSRQVHDHIGFTQVDEAGTLVGPHGGLGIEFGVGDKASINFDARYTGYLNKPVGDLTVPGAFQANMGLNFYF